MKIVQESAKLLNCALETLAAIRTEMDKLASMLPEHEIVMSLYGVERVMCSQLIVEIDDVRRLKCAKLLVAMAGIDPPTNQSGQVDVKPRSISKRGSSLLRKTLFQIMLVILQNKPNDKPVYQFLGCKRTKGKPQRVYIIVAAHELLRIYLVSKLPTKFQLRQRFCRILFAFVKI